MRQLKYPIYACLLLLFFSIGLSLIIKLSKMEIVKESISAPAETGHAQTLVMSKGELTFKNYCASCHSLSRDVVGPALNGVDERGPWSDRANLFKWVRNPPLFMQNDPYTQGLKAKFGTMMTQFPQLTDQELNDIFDFIKATPSKQYGVIKAKASANS